MYSHTLPCSKQDTFSAASKCSQRHAPLHQLHVEAWSPVHAVTKRLGGGFGGKASRSMPVAAAAALAASMFGAPVCYSLSRSDDFAQNAGRCAGRVRYDVGFSPSGKVVAIKAEVRAGGQQGWLKCWWCCQHLLVNSQC